MIQIKLVHVGDLKTLNDNVNETLAGIPSEAIKEPIKFDFSEMVAIIQFELIEEWKNRMCAECRYFDDGGEPSADRSPENKFMVSSFVSSIIHRSFYMQYT